MAKDVSDVIGTTIGPVREGIQSISKSARKRSKGVAPGKAVAAGAAGLGLVAFAPRAAKGVTGAWRGKIEDGDVKKSSRSRSKNRSSSNRSRGASNGGGRSTRSGDSGSSRSSGSSRRRSGSHG